MSNPWCGLCGGDCLLLYEHFGEGDPPEDDEENLYPPDRPISLVDVILAIEEQRGAAMFSATPRDQRDYAVLMMDELECTVRALLDYKAAAPVAVEEQVRPSADATPTSNTDGEGEYAK